MCKRILRTSRRPRLLPDADADPFADRFRDSVGSRDHRVAERVDLLGELTDGGGNVGVVFGLTHGASFVRVDPVTFEGPAGD